MFFSVARLTTVCPKETSKDTSAGLGYTFGIKFCLYLIDGHGSGKGARIGLGEGEMRQKKEEKEYL